MRADAGIALAFIATVRELGRGALRAEDLARDGLPGAIELGDALDVFDRQLDHIEGWLIAHPLPEDDAGWKLTSEPARPGASAEGALPDPETETLLARAEKLRRPRPSRGNQEYAPPGTADFVTEVAFLIPQLVAELGRVTAERDEAYRRVGEADAQRMVAIRKNDARVREFEAAEAEVVRLTRELELARRAEEQLGRAGAALRELRLAVGPCPPPERAHWVRLSAALREARSVLADLGGSTAESATKDDSGGGVPGEQT